MRRCHPILLVGLLALSPPTLNALVVVGQEFRINSYTTQDQSDPYLSHGPGGEFVVVWKSLGPDGGSYGVFGQRYSSGGAPVASEFQVNTFTTSHQRDPSVSHGPSGEFVVVWESLGQDGSASGVFGQRYASIGAPAGLEFQVNTYTSGIQRFPVVSHGPGGEFVVVWNGAYRQDGSQYGVFGQRFTSQGAVVGSEFQINTFTTSYQLFPSLSHGPGGEFTVVWASYGQDGPNFGIFGQRFTSEGARTGGEFQVNTFTNSFQGNSSVASGPVGEFVVVWESYEQDGSDLGVFGQRFGSTGAMASSEFQINTFTTSRQRFPSVSYGPAGEFTAVWHSDGQDGSNYGVFGQHFTSTGARAGSEFQVNSYTTDKQFSLSVSHGPGGELVVVWQSTGQDGSGAGVFGQRYAPETPTVTATPTLTATASTTTTPTSTPAPPSTTTPSPTETNTVSPGATPTFTLVPTASLTSTVTQTQTVTPSIMATATGTMSPTAMPSATPSLSATGSPTRTATFTAMPASTPTRTSSQTPTATQTRTRTITSTRTRTPTKTTRPSSTPANTPTTGPTPSRTPTPGACNVSELALVLPQVATSCDQCGAGTDLNCSVNVQVSVISSGGVASRCFVGTFLVDSSDPAAGRTSPLTYSSGTTGLIFPYSPVAAGTHTITIRQISGTVAQNGMPLIASAQLLVEPNTRSDQFWVSAEHGAPNATGAYVDPFDTITSALGNIPAGVAHPCIRVQAGTYVDRPIVDRPATIVGDSIGGCILQGQGAADALTIALTGTGSRVRRFTLTGAASSQEPILAGLWVYGASDLTLSNLLIRGNNNGARLEESSGIELSNCTIVQNLHDAVYGSFVGASLGSNIIRQNSDCDVFQGATAGDRMLTLSFNNLSATTLCRDLDPGPGSGAEVPELLDPSAWTLDLFSQRNKLSGVVDGGEDPSGKKDIDDSLRDRGAYGGPWGEVHYEVFLPAPRQWTWFALGFVLAGAGAALKIRRRVPQNSGGDSDRAGRSKQT